MIIRSLRDIGPETNGHVEVVAWLVRINFESRCENLQGGYALRYVINI